MLGAPCPGKIVFGQPDDCFYPIEAGVDLIQHPEVLAGREISDGLEKLKNLQREYIARSTSTDRKSNGVWRTPAGSQEPLRLSAL